MPRLGSSPTPERTPLIDNGYGDPMNDPEYFQQARTAQQQVLCCLLLICVIMFIIMFAVTMFYLIRSAVNSAVPPGCVPVPPEFNLFPTHLVQIKDNFFLDRFTIYTPSGTSVATIKKNGWGALSTIYLMDARGNLIKRGELSPLTPYQNFMTIMVLFL
jgi:hypothetical protein